MSEEDLSGLKVVELKARLSDLGLPVSGKKADLITRLETAIAMQAMQSEEEEAEEDDDVILLEEEDEEEEEDEDEDEPEEAEVIEEAELIEDAEIVEEEAPEVVAPPVRERKEVSARMTPQAAASIVVIALLLTGAGWWYWVQNETVHQAAPPRYGDHQTFRIMDGNIEAQGDEMVAHLRSAAEGALDRVCERIAIQFSGTGEIGIHQGSLGDMLDPTAGEPGPVIAHGPYGRMWMAVQEDISIDVNADLNGRSFSEIDPDRCSGLEFSMNGNQVEASLSRWNEQTEGTLLRTSSTLEFTDLDGRSSTVAGTTFGAAAGSDLVNDMLEMVLLPMRPVDLYDMFGIQTLDEGASGESGSWQWSAGKTVDFNGEDARIIYLDNDDAKKCLGRATVTLWVLSDQPWPARQSVDIELDKEHARYGGCGTVNKAAIDFGFPEGTFTARYTMEQTSFTSGDALATYGTYYAGRPLSGQDMPDEDEQLNWNGATHMPDLSTDRAFTLEEAVACVANSSDETYGSATSALASGGYIFHALDDRAGSTPQWNLSWVTSTEAGYVVVGQTGDDSCYFVKDGPLTGDERPEHSREDIPATHSLSSLEARAISASKYPNLAASIASGGDLRDDAALGYRLTVPVQNDLWDLLPDEYRQGQVSLLIERTWSNGGIDHSLSAAMDAERGRMIGWVQTSTPAD